MVESAGLRHARARTRISLYRAVSEEGLRLAWTSPGVTGLRGGACGISDGETGIRALGELVERTSLHLFSTSGALQRCPISAFDPSVRRRLPIAAVWSDRALHCVDAKAILSGELEKVPAQWAICGREMRSEPRLCVQTSMGTAAARSPLEAVLHALHEVREREIVLKAWQTGDASFVDVTDIALDALGPPIRAGLQRSGAALGVFLFDEPGPFVTIATLTDAAGAFSAGAASKPTLAAAAVHASAEASGVRQALRSTRPPSALEARSFRAGHAISALGRLHTEFIAGRLRRRSPGAQEAGRSVDWSPEQLAGDLMIRTGTAPLRLSLPSIHPGLFVERVVVPGSSIYRPPSAPIDFSFGPLA